MKITDLEVDGFGVWSGLRLNALNDPLVVFYGPNEAGKTTLMQFVRSVMYGFSTERRARYLPPLAGGRAGGALRIMHAERNLTVRRRDSGDDPVGEIELIDRQGVQPDDLALSDLLGDVGESVFNHVFALGLREIQELGTLSDTEAAHLLYDLTLGLDHVSLADVLRELGTSRTRLLAADERPSLVVQLLGQRDRLKQELDELTALAPKYLELLDTRRQAEREIASAQESQDAAVREQRIFDLARSLTDKWRQRARTEQQLAALGSPPEVAEGAVERLNRLNERIAARRQQLAELKLEHDKLKGEADGLVINEKLCRQAARLEALSEQQQWMAALAGQVSQLKAEITQIETEHKAGDERLGFVSTRTSGSPPDIARDLGQLRVAAKALSAARTAYRQVRQKTLKIKQAAGEMSGQLQTSLGKQAEEGLDKAIERAGVQVSQLRRRVQIDQRLDQMSRRQTELEGQSRDWLQRQVMPLWQAVGVGSLFVLGCGLILLYAAGMVLPATMTGSLTWPVGLVGIALAGTGGAAKFLIERFAADQLDTSYEQLAALKQQTEEAKRERDALDKQLPRGGGPLVSRLQAAEAELAQLEELLPMESQRKSADREARQARQQKQAVQAEYKKARGRWLSALSSAGLPETVKPSQLRDYERHHEQLRESLKRLDARRQELADRNREHQMLTARIAQLVSEVGLKSVSSDPLVQLREMLSALAEHDARFKRREGLLAQVTGMRRKKNRADRALDKLKTHHKTLLREAGTNEEAEFRRLVAVQLEQRQLQSTRQQLVQDIAAAVAGQCSEDTIADYLDSNKNLDRVAEEFCTTLAAVKTQLAQLFEQRGELNQQIKTLAEDRRLENKRIELGMVEERLREALDRWRVLAVCDTALETVRAFYEREHQPQVLREASGYLQKLTGGRYTRVWTPLGQHVLRVDDAQGQPLPVDVLSRGTREQLFLSLRFALVNAYAARGVRLPLVLDDVLVNFDAGRARLAASVLRDFAKGGNQVLIFTCHEHIARLFRNVKADVRELPDNSRPRSVVVEEGLPKMVEVVKEEPTKKPRRVKPEPEPMVEVQPLVELPPPPPPPVSPLPPLPVVLLERIVPKPIVVAPPAREPEPAPLPPPPVVMLKPVVAAAPLRVEPPPQPRELAFPARFMPSTSAVTVAPQARVEMQTNVIAIYAPAIATPEPAPSPPQPVASPPPPPAPVRRRRVRYLLERDPWNAEEFSGELTDWVWRDEPLEEDVP